MIVTKSCEDKDSYLVELNSSDISAVKMLSRINCCESTDVLELLLVKGLDAAFEHLEQKTSDQ